MAARGRVHAAALGEENAGNAESCQKLQPGRHVFYSVRARIYDLGCNLSSSKQPTDSWEDGTQGKLADNSFCLSVLVEEFQEMGSLCSSYQHPSERSVEYADYHLKDMLKHIKALSDCRSSTEVVIQSLVLEAVQAYNSRKSTTKVKIGSSWTPLEGQRQASASWLRHNGYDAAICTTSWPQSVGKTGGQNEFIDILGDLATRSKAAERILVDIDFPRHFQIARPTPEFSALFKQLPHVFVGTKTRLLQIIAVMSDALKRSLRSASMPLPPWRRAEHLHAQWFSPHMRSTPEGVHVPVKECPVPRKRFSASFARKVGVGASTPLKLSVGFSTRELLAPAVQSGDGSRACTETKAFVVHDGEAERHTSQGTARRSMRVRSKQPLAFTSKRWINQDDGPANKGTAERNLNTGTSVDVRASQRSQGVKALVERVHESSASGRRMEKLFVNNDNWQPPLVDSKSSMSARKLKAGLAALFRAEGPLEKQ